jgi:hypothetical protein
MTGTIKPTAVYEVSSELIAREVDGELVLIPLPSNEGALAAGIFQVSNTGKSILDRLDGRRSLCNVIDDLFAIYDSSRNELEKDVVAFVEELLRRGLVIEVEPH